MADSSACVYGDSGSAYSAFFGAISIILPRYMTPTRSDTCFTTFRPCAMNRYVRPNCSLSSSSRFSTCAWIDTSKAETGSSHTMSFGFTARARAMPTRWRWPPENSWG